MEMIFAAYTFRKRKVQMIESDSEISKKLIKLLPPKRDVSHRRNINDLIHIHTTFHKWNS